MKRVFLIVLDSCGVGYEPDAAEFGDVGANTLHTCSQSPKFVMPNLISMGLGNLDGVDYLPKADQSAGRACETAGAFARQGHDHRPLGDRGPRLAAAAADVSRTAFLRRS
ncbi:MAG: hypothetical protein ACLUN5_00565 [Oscillospiraceae bacterium]